jgi:hypothetical protein
MASPSFECRANCRSVSAFAGFSGMIISCFLASLACCYKPKSTGDSNMPRMFTSTLTATGVAATLFAAVPCNAAQQYPYRPTYQYNSNRYYTQSSHRQDSIMRYNTNQYNTYQYYNNEYHNNQYHTNHRRTNW